MSTGGRCLDYALAYLLGLDDLPESRGSLRRTLELFPELAYWPADYGLTWAQRDGALPSFLRERRWIAHLNEGADSHAIVVDGRHEPSVFSARWPRTSASASLLSWSERQSSQMPSVYSGPSAAARPRLATHRSPS